jgi:MSHA biogenesis protein MshM
LSKHTSYVEHFQLTHTPFGQESDPEIFFADGGREEVLRQLLSAIEEREPLIRLTGSEGAGKTLLCRLLAERLSSSRYNLVCLDHPVGSFEDLLRLICLALGRKAEEKNPDPRSFLPEFLELLKERKVRQVRVVLIIDDADKLFLATLERLVRLTCDGDAEGVLQILLVGRPELNRNLDQLAVYCAGIDLETRYVLEPLSREETGRYIQFRLESAGAPGDKVSKIFTGDAFTAIHQAAGGNIRRIGMLAEKGLTVAYEKGLSRVEAETIFPRLKEEDKVRSRFGPVIEWLRQHRLWVLPGLAFVLILLLLPLWTDRERESSVRAPGEKLGPAVEELPSIGPFEPALGKRPPPLKNGPAGDREGPAAVEGPASREESPQLKEPLAADSTRKEEGRKPEVRKEQEPATLEVPAAAFAPKKEMVVIQPDVRKRRDLPPPATEKEPDTRNPHEIFQERIRATSNWLAWSYRGGYTIQLMMLVSETAEENFKALLARDDYYSVKDELYILRKTSSPTLLVFYGLYDTLAQARSVRDSLPQFLLKNQPYALSIKEALEKAGE